ncbi:MAG: transposase [Deltaproteobacteria bacterium]|nr:transposase [Deltaproteobacteria bacterium]
MKKPASDAQRKSRKRALEPWLLATSLPVETANSIVKLYAKRMQIEEGFRDIKIIALAGALRIRTQNHQSAFVCCFSLVPSR